MNLSLFGNFLPLLTRCRRKAWNADINLTGYWNYYFSRARQKMKRINRSIKALRAIKHPSVVAALAAAIPTADPDAQTQIVMEFLKRGTRDARAGLIHHFGHLNAEAKAIAIAHVADLASAVGDALVDRRSQRRRHAIAMVTATRSTAFLPKIATATGDGDQDVRDAALDCLITWPPPAQDDSSDENLSRHAINQAIIAAMAHFDRHQSDALLSRMLELNLSWHALRPVLSKPESQLATALRQRIALAKEPAIRQSTLQWLALPELRQPARHAIRLASQQGWFGQLLQNGHLLGNDELRRTIASEQNSKDLVPSLPQQATMSSDGLRQLSTWVATIPLTDDDRIAAFAQIARSQDPGARLFALRRLIAAPLLRSKEAKTNLIAAFCHDEDVRIARVAVRHLIASNPDNLPRTLLRLINSEHEDIRELAGQRVAPWGFIWFWNAWSNLPGRQRLSAASALMKIDPRFHRQLGDRLLSRKPEERLKALTMVGDLNQGVFYENALIAVARSTRTREVASAVRGLASIKSDLASHVLEASLAHADSRVRANAVEALGRRRAKEHVGQLESMAERESNRPRANAIVELYKLDRPVAFDALTAMLDDSQHNHRISGLWLADDQTIVRAAPKIVELSVADSDPSVRTRAQRTFSSLLTALMPSEALNSPENRLKPTVALV